MATRLFALEGTAVAEVDAGAGGGRTVWVVTDDLGAAACPGCGTVSAHVKGYVTTRPADLRHGRGQIAVVWVKGRWKCRSVPCERKGFPKSRPAAPSRGRVTTGRRGTRPAWSPMR